MDLQALVNTHLAAEDEHRLVSKLATLVEMAHSRKSTHACDVGLRRPPGPLSR